MIGKLHSRFVQTRRVAVLRQWVERLLPRLTASVLDVGSGNGLLLSLVAQARPELAVAGIDVLPHAHSYIPVTLFDGKRIPHGDQSFDAVLLIDVLHHTDDPAALLAEASRVARHCLIIKDHLLEGWLAAERLKFLDYFGNAAYGVALPYNFWTRQQWDAAFAKLGLAVREQQTDLKLYPWFADRVFGTSLHFVARLEKS